MFNDVKTVIRINHIQTTDPKKTEIETVLSLIDRFALDRAYELNGGFIERGAKDEAGNWIDGVTNAWRFSGDFIGYTRPFSIVTNDPVLIGRLSYAIFKNRKGVGYLRQTPPYDPRKLVIERKQFGKTGEVALYYKDREFLGWFDDLLIHSETEVKGQEDGFWHYKAKKILAQRHYDEHMAGRIPELSEAERCLDPCKAVKADRLA